MSILIKVMDKPTDSGIDADCPLIELAEQTEPQTDCETCKYDVSEDDNDLYDMCEPMVEGECRYEPHKRKGEPMSEYNIPEKDKVCVNCLHFGSASRTGNVDLCGGERPCVNYAVGNTENFFVPDDWYMKDRFGCKACRHYHHTEENCQECSRLYEDRWERRTEND